MKKPITPIVMSDALALRLGVQPLDQAPPVRYVIVRTEKGFYAWKVL